MLIHVSSGAGSVLTLQEAQSHLRVNIDTEDTDIYQLIADAQDYIQEETGIRFYADVYKEVFSMFPYRIDLTRYPVASVTSVEYATDAATLATVSSSNYTVMTPTYAPAWIVPNFNTIWPVPFLREDAVQVTYVTGRPISPLVKRAAKLLIGHWYFTRENQVDYIPQEIKNGVRDILNKVSRKSVL